MPAVLWLFGEALWGGRLLYFRDLSNYYAPSFAFAAESLRRGTWPLWNPTVHAGEPFLLAYPVDLLLLWFRGWHAGLGVGPALHLWLALAGGTFLARRLGLSPWAAWLTGTAYGLSGFVLSLVNLVQLFEAAAWAPWVIAAGLALAGRPSAPRSALFALLLALQASTLGIELVAQTLAVVLVLALDARWLRPRRWLPLLGAGLLAASVAAPALAGAAWITRGSARAEGFSRGQLLAFSLHPATLPEIALPRWSGSPHAFSDADYWAAPFLPEGYPYLVSLYAGAGVLLLAAQAGRQRRLWALVIGGLLLAIGSHGPLGWLPSGLTLPVRGPQKLLFLAQVGLSLLAGFGLDRRAREPLRGARLAPLLLAGASVAGLAAAVRLAPEAFVRGAGWLLPGLHDGRALVAARLTWPSAWLPAGLLAVAGGLALARGGRVARLAALAAALDLALAHGALNPLAPASFYDLRPQVAELLRPVREQGGRVFSYGVAQTPGLEFEPPMRAAASDVWLYYLDRQSLLPSTPVLDHLDVAGGPDQTGFTPAGASLEPAEAVPERFLEHRGRLARAAVRWVLSFRPLPAAFAQPRGSVKLPEIGRPLQLFELPSALPRALFVPAAEVAPDRATLRRRLEDPGFDPFRTVLLEASPAVVELVPARAPGAAEVSVSREDPHTIRVELRSPPGFLLLADGHHPDWQAEDAAGAAVPVLRANDRYCALPTPGGRRTMTLRFRPGWPVPSFLVAALGFLTAVALLLSESVSRTTGLRAVLRARLRPARGGPADAGDRPA